MVSTKSIGKYRVRETIGEGTFSKVKLAFNSSNGEKVAIKVIDKQMVLKNNLRYQVQSEITTMKLLNHPNIVRIHEVIGTKTKIYIVMEYVSGGQLLDKMSYANKLDECEARKLFQQLIDTVDYCHNKGVYHRDLKPENLLLDSKGNLKVSDFGLSALAKFDDVLNTKCGSPCYVAPEVLMNKGYDGAAVDVWSCGVILFELLAGFLPFDDQNLMGLYHKICRAEYTCPPWFTISQKKLIAKILEPRSEKRITISDIIENEWFKKDYQPVRACEFDTIINLDEDSAAFDSIEEKTTNSTITKSSSFINAFQLIAMFQDFDLSSLFEEQDHKKQITMLGSQHTITETVEKIEAAATDVRLSVEKMNNFKMKMHPKLSMTRCSRSYFDLSAEVIEVAPTHCVIQISKSAGDLRMYNRFCESLSSLLKENSNMPSQGPDSVDQCDAGSIEKQDAECYEKPNSEDIRGYKSA
ncbi:CBL-interacting serine/threonine-protein kinase 21 isoform X2 [Trifolium pratense]|uniref:CBL-interacting serine/threonine-protein kinase 21 isoform X2 n=1 Tax=Trifolium pratense TaxID=57577 RepID=UPI001E691317|nr:CBL-interacting serine/threonine-protein kinase 21 isoform X2 [Trifolium pratense]